MESQSESPTSSTSISRGGSPAGAGGPATEDPGDKIMAMKTEKLCVVCGDKALGFNFGAITCESCKAFFRRNAVGKKELKCPFEMKCEVTSVTRRFCQRCRLVKCFAKGMKKESILSPNEKLAKKQKIEENRQRKMKMKQDLSLEDPEEDGAKRLKMAEEDSSPIPVSSPGPLPLVYEPPTPSNPDYSAPQYKDFHHNYKIYQDQPQNYSTSSVSSPASVIKQQAFQLTSNNDFLDQVVSVAIKAEFHTTNLSIEGSPKGPVDMATPSGDQPGICDPLRGLNDEEKSRIQELYDASRSLNEPMEHDREELRDQSNISLFSVIKLTDLAIKRIIKMARNIRPFINMCQEDKIALLKGGCTELMILRSIINYNPEKNSWILPSKDNKELRLDVLKQANHYGVQLYEEHKRFVQSFDDRWRSDEYVMLLLSAIALFNPDRSNVLHKDVVKLEQDTYYYLLRRYLQCVCTNGCMARSAYLHLIGKLKDLHRLNESHIQLFLEVDPQCVEPLLIEIFDLKPPNAH